MQNTKNILLLHNVKDKFSVPQNYLDFIKSFLEFSVNTISYLDPSEDSLTLEEINLYDVVVVHHSIILFSQYCLPSFWRILLRMSTNKKVLFIQDDFRKVNETLESIRYIGFSIIFTCLSENVKDKIYISDQINHTKVISILTAYTPEYFKKIPLVSYQDRDWDVVYRGRKGSAWYGDLVREKWIIGENFKQDALLYGLKINISSDEKERVYGRKWIDFLLSAKCVLGTESSSNVVDYDGSIEERVLKYEKENPNASYEEIKNLYFKDIDGKLELNMLPPKIFEYAATRTLMILYEGNYSGILEPWRHYIPLKKDHSNMDQVVVNIRSHEQWEKITQCAYNDLVASDKYSYKKLIDIFDHEINSLDIPIKNNCNIKPVIRTLKINEVTNKNSTKIDCKIFIKKVAFFLFQKFLWLKKIYHFFKVARILLNQKKYYYFFYINSSIISEILMNERVIQHAEEIKKKTGIIYPDKKKWLAYLSGKNKNFLFCLLKDPIFKVHMLREIVSQKRSKKALFVVNLFKKRIDNLIKTVNTL